MINMGLGNTRAEWLAPAFCNVGWEVDVTPNIIDREQSLFGGTLRVESGV